MKKEKCVWERERERERENIIKKKVCDVGNINKIS